MTTWIVMMSLFGVSYAAPYGSGNYGQCAYQTSCTVTQPVPSPQPPAGEPAPDTNPAPAIVTTDIDKDGNPETATDTDNNLDNGYETFTDPDGSSHLIVTTDGEHDGKKDYLIDTNNDGVPDVYWSPDDQYLSEVTVRDTETEIAWLFTNAKGEVQAYVVLRKQPRPVTTGGSTNQTTERDHRLTPNTFGGAVYEKIGKVIQDVPKPVAYSFPYILLILIGVLTARLLFQTRRELRRIGAIKAAATREKQLELEKQNFLMLVSHYLRTPVTVMKGNIELAASLKSIPEAGLQNLQAVVTSLQSEIDNLLGSLSENKAPASVVQAPVSQIPAKRVIFSPFVIGPLAGIIALLVFANLLFIDFKVIEPTFVDFLVQVLLVVILGQWFISSFRKRHLRSQELTEEQYLLEQQRNLDRSRADFMTQAMQGLSGYVDNFGRQLGALTAAGHDTSRIRIGYEQLNEVMRKFMLAASLQAPVVEAQKQKLDNAQVVQEVVGRGQPKAAAKQLQLSSTAEGGSVTQNQQLANLVLDSLVDNAIKYSPENEVVTIAQRNEKAQTLFDITDRGKGMTAEQLDLLFKPFSRTESAETFNTEGLGFGLYLSQLIAHYMGGEVSVASNSGKGTQAVLSLPKV